MNAGDLNKRITLQKLNTITNDNGFEEQVWQDYKTVWASVSNLFGREFFQAQEVQAEKTVKFTVRYSKELDSNINEYGPYTTKLFRIKFNNSTFDISFIDNIRYSNTYLEIKTLGVT